MKIHKGEIMFIESIKLHNFKSFSSNNFEDLQIKFTPGVNYLIGNNNVGKTSIFNAIDFLISGEKKENIISKGHEDEDVSVTIVLSEVEPFEGSLKKYNSYIKDKQLTLQRSSKEETIKQGEKGKEKNIKLDIKKVRVFNYSNNQFENPTGVSNTITELIDPQIVYADIHNEDYQDFGTTKLTGKLLQVISKPFQDTDEFKNLKNSYETAFASDCGIKKFLSKTENELDKLLEEQFGNSKMEFTFNFPSVNELLKKGNILCTENNIKTDISEKGNGLQRAFALAIIQVYSNVYSKTHLKDKNTQYLIDEPEIYLHPKAQDKLIDSLVKLSEKGNQVFITTHSPYVLRHYCDDKEDSIIIFSVDKKTNQKEIKYISSLWFSPTSIGEVTYKAFKVPTTDFHQLLFTKLYLYWIESTSPKHISLSNFEKNFLQPKCEEQGLKLKPYTARYGEKWHDKTEHSLPYIVRNEIDHPEVLDGNKNVWKEDDLKKSIECLLEIYKSEIVQCKK